MKLPFTVGLSGRQIAAVSAIGIVSVILAIVAAYVIRRLNSSGTPQSEA